MANEEVKFDAEQQKLVDKLVGEARIKARDRAKADHEAQSAKDKDTASQATLAAEAKWKELAAVHEARVKVLEPLEAQAQAYEKLIADMLKDRVKALGDAAKKAVDALPEAMSAVEKLAWLNENEELFQSPGDGVGTPGRLAKGATDKKKPAGPVCKFPLRL